MLITKWTLRADLQCTIFVARDMLTTGLQRVCDCRVRQRKCRSTLKHVLKRCDNRKSCRRHVISLSHAPKSHRVNRPLDFSGQFVTLIKIERPSLLTNPG